MSDKTKCPLCGSQAYIGFESTVVECSNETCEKYSPSLYPPELSTKDWSVKEEDTTSPDIKEDIQKILKQLRDPNNPFDNLTAAERKQLEDDIERFLNNADDSF